MKSAGLVIILTLLSACGSQSNKQAPDHQQLLLSALAAGNATQINTHKNQSQLSTKDKKIINLYLSVLDKKPYRVISDSQQIIKIKSGKFVAKLGLDCGKEGTAGAFGHGSDLASGKLEIYLENVDNENRDFNGGYLCRTESIPEYWRCS